jgi:hypothetical protein
MEDKLFYFQPTTLPSLWSNLKKTVTNQPTVSIIKNTPESSTTVLTNVHKLYVTLIGGGGSGSLGELRPINHTQYYARDRTRYDGISEKDAFDEMTNMLPLAGCGGGAGSTIFRLPIILIQKNTTTVQYSVGQGGTGMTVDKDGSGQYIDPVTLQKYGSVNFYNDKEFRRGRNGTDTSVIINQTNSNNVNTRTVRLKAMGGGGGGVAGYFVTRKDIYNMKSNQVQYTWGYSFGSEFFIDDSPTDKNIYGTGSGAEDGNWHHYWYQRGSIDPSSSQYKDKTHFSFLAEHYTRIFSRPAYTLLAIHREMDYFIGSEYPSDAAENRNEYIPYNFLTHGEAGILHGELLRPDQQITLGGITKYVANPLKSTGQFPVPNTPGVKEMSIGYDQRSFNFIHQYAPDYFYTDDRGNIGIFGYQIQSLRGHPRYYMSFGKKFGFKDRSVNFPGDQFLPRDIEGGNKMIIVADTITGDVLLEKWTEDFTKLMDEYGGPLIMQPQRKGERGAFGGAGGGFMFFDESTPSTLDGLFGGKSITNPWGLPYSGRGGNPYPRKPTSIISSINLNGANYYYGGEGYDDANSSGQDVFVTTYFIPGSGGGSIEFVHTSHRLSKRNYSGETVDFKNTLPSFSESTYTSFNKSIYDWYVDNYEKIGTGGKVIYRVRNNNNLISRFYFNDEFGRHKISYKDREVKDLLKIFAAGGGGGKAFHYLPGNGQENPEMPPSIPETGCGSGGSCSLNADGEGVIAGLPFGTVDYYLRRMIEYDEAQDYVDFHIKTYFFTVATFFYIMYELLAVSILIQVAVTILTAGAGTVASTIAGLSKSTISAMPKIVGVIVKVIQAVMRFIDKITKLLNTLKSIFKSIWEAAKIWFKSLKWVASLTAKLAKAGATKFGKIMTMIGKLLKNVAKAVANGLKLVFSLLTGDFVGALDVLSGGKFGKMLADIGTKLGKQLMSGLLKLMKVAKTTKEALKIVDAAIDVAKAIDTAIMAEESAMTMKRTLKWMTGSSADELAKAKNFLGDLLSPGRIEDIAKNPSKFIDELNNMKFINDADKADILKVLGKQIDPPPINLTDNLAKGIDDVIPNPSSLNPPTSAIDDVGKSVDNVADTASDLAKKQDDLATAFKGSSNDIAKAANKPPTDDLKKVIEQLRDSYEAQAKNLKKLASGSINEMAEAVNFFSDSNKLSTIPEQLRISIGNYLTEGLDEVVQNATKSVDDIAESLSTKSDNIASSSPSSSNIDAIKSANAKVAEVQDRIKALTNLQESLAKSGSSADDIASSINNLANTNNKMQRSLNKLKNMGQTLGDAGKEAVENTSKLLNESDEIFKGMNKILDDFPEVDALMNAKPPSNLYLSKLEDFGKKIGIIDDTSYSNAYLSIKASSSDTDMVGKIMSSSNMKNTFMEKLAAGDFIGKKFSTSLTDTKTINEFTELVGKSEVLKSAILKDPTIIKNFDVLSEAIPPKALQDIKFNAYDSFVADLNKVTPENFSDQMKILRGLSEDSEEFKNLKNYLNNQLRSKQSEKLNKFKTMLENIDPADIRALRNNIELADPNLVNKVAGKKFFDQASSFLETLENQKQFIKEIDELGNIKIIVVGSDGRQVADLTNLVKEMRDTQKTLLNLGQNSSNAPEVAKINNVLKVDTVVPDTPDVFNKLKGSFDDTMGNPKILENMEFNSTDEVANTMNKQINEFGQADNSIKNIETRYSTDSNVLDNMNDPEVRGKLKQDATRRLNDLRDAKNNIVNKMETKLTEVNSNFDNYVQEFKLNGGLSGLDDANDMAKNALNMDETAFKAKYGQNSGDKYRYLKEIDPKTGTTKAQSFIDQKAIQTKYQNALDGFKTGSIPNPIDDQIAKTSNFINNVDNLPPVSTNKIVKTDLDPQVFRYSSDELARRGVNDVDAKKLDDMYRDQGTLDSVKGEVNNATESIDNQIQNLNNQITDLRSSKPKEADSTPALNQAKTNVESKTNQLEAANNKLNGAMNDLKEKIKNFHNYLETQKFDPDTLKKLKTALATDSNKSLETLSKLFESGDYPKFEKYLKDILEGKVFEGAKNKYFNLFRDQFQTNDFYTKTGSKLRGFRAEINKLNSQLSQLNKKVTQEVLKLTEFNRGLWGPHNEIVEAQVKSLNDKIAALYGNKKVLEDASNELSKIKINKKPVAPDVFLSVTSPRILQNDPRTFVLWTKEFTLPTGIHTLPLSKDVIQSSFKSLFPSIPTMVKVIGKVTYKTLHKMNNHYGTNEFTKGIEMKYKDGNRIEEIRSEILLDSNTTEENYTEKIANDILTSNPENLTQNRLDAYSEIYYHTFEKPMKIEKKEVDNKLIQVMVENKNKGINIDLTYAQKYVNYDNLNVNNKLYYKYLFQNYSDMKNILVSQINIINKNMILV